VSRLTRLIRFLSPWIALGLAGALLTVVLRPSLLPARSEPLRGTGTAEQVMARHTTPVAAPGTTPSIAATLVSDPAAPVAPVARGVAATSFADAIARVAPAVVNVSTRRTIVERRPLDLSSLFDPNASPVRRREELSRGSGVILDAAGHVATNFHVVRGVEEIRVQLVDGRSAKARLVGTDPETDLAILQVSLDHLPVMPLGRSDRLRVGDVVLAIGFPLNLGQTVTQGICSATGRSQLGLAMLENFIQTDAAINPGNSGGALVTADGELVGINTAILSHENGAEGIGFAIPVNLVRGVAEEIEAHGRVSRGWSGLAVDEPVGVDGQPLRGVEVLGMHPEGPGPKAALRPGDVLTHLDGKDIAGPQDFLGQIARKKPGSVVHLKGLRPGRGGFDTDMPVAERPPVR
jgi:S1-C subfamily serine protease